jgi:hypothetical protein
MAAALCVLALYSRRPDALGYPQFFAEDGHVWYAQAYNWGWFRALTRPDGGYFQTLPRLVAAVSLLFPVASAPLIFNISGLAAESAPAVFLLSPRFRNLGTLRLRCLLAGLYIAMPNMAGVHATIEYSQWHLAVLAFLVLVGEPSESRVGRLFDVAVLALCALTGPFCIFLVATMLALRRFLWNRWHYVRLSLLGGGATLQITSLLFSAGRQRSHPAIGASFAGYCRIIAGQIVDPVLEGENRLQHWAHSPRGVLAAAAILTALATAAGLYALWKGSFALRSLVLFAALVLGSSLVFSVAPENATLWGQLAVPGAGARYWMIPELTLIIVVVWMTGSQRPRALRLLAATLTCVMIVGIVKHWRYSALQDFDYPEQIGLFQQAQPGTAVRILTPPAGWEMTLVKK